MNKKAMFRTPVSSRSLRLRAALLMLSSVGPFACAAPTPPLSAPDPKPSATAAQADSFDYLVLVPRDLARAVEPIVKLRSEQGHTVRVRLVEDVYVEHPGSASHEEALLDEVKASAQRSPKLHFLLLAGDPRGEPTALPAFHRKLGEWVGGRRGDEYATDHPYALFPEHPLAVGRLPARNVDEMKGMVSKVVAYETLPHGEWGRRVLFFAGPTNFSGPLDSTIQEYATNKLDSSIPHDFDLGVIFAQPSSQFTFRLDRLGHEMAAEMSAGALLAVFAGHGSSRSLDSVRYRDKRYPIGKTEDFQAINAATGNPIFIALTCSAGTFDQPARSIAEVAILNPHGPVSAFAAGAFSGAYVNLLYSDLLIDSFLVSRRPTVGDALLAVNKALPSSSSLLKVMFRDDDGDGATDRDAIEEHLFIYNLFGDPATRPAYLERADIALASASVAPHTPFKVKLRLPPHSSHARVTLETERTELKDGMVEPEALDQLDLPAAFDAMERNHALANDKVLSSVEVNDVEAPVDLVSPSKPGTYWVRVVADGVKGSAGAVKLDVQ